MLIAVLLLAAAGLVAGLVPGIHMNTFSALASRLPIPAEALALGLGAAFVAHSASSLLPSIFLGAPSEATALSVLPGHSMLLKGEGKKALRLSMYGLVLGSLFFLILAGPLYGILPIAMPFLRSNMGVILAVASGYMIIREKEPTKALFVFALSGALGIVVLGMPLREETKLFTLLTGAFGLSGLLMGSLSGKSTLPAQKPNTDDEPGLKTLARPAAVGTLAGALVGTLPAMSSSVSLSLVGAFFERKFWEGEEMLVSIGAANVTGFLFSLVTLSSVGKARNGTAHAISGLVDGGSVLLAAGAALAAVFASVAAVVFLSGRFVSAIRKVNYTTLNGLSLLFLLLLVFAGGGPVGLLIAATAASVGLLTMLWDIGRANTMGMLLVPTILFYMGL